MDDIEARQQLNALGKRRAANIRKRAALDADDKQILLDLAKLAPKAQRAGISKSEIAQRTNISRQTLYSSVFKD